MTSSIIERLREEAIDEISVGYRTYKLNIKRGLKLQEDKCYGLVDFDIGILYLEKDMDHQTARETLVHELTHIALELGGLGGEEDTNLVGPYTNEHITTVLSRGWLSLINLNPRLFAIINERPTTD